MPSEKHHQLEFEEDLGVDGGATGAGIAIGDEIADEGEIEDAMEVPVEVISRHRGLHRDEGETVEIAGFRWAEHCSPPFKIH